MRGSRSIIVHFACNDHRNGHFAGEAEGCSLDIGGMPLELEGWARRFTVDEARLRFCIHGAWFPFMSSREWVGNWCWNAYRMKRPQAIRLMTHLRWHGWTCSGGRTRLCDWYDGLPVAATPSRALSSVA